MCFDEDVVHRRKLLTKVYTFTRYDSRLRFSPWYIQLTCKSTIPLYDSLTNVAIPHADLFD